MRRLSRTVLTSLSLAMAGALVSTRASAQSLADLPVGARVRVTLADTGAPARTDVRRHTIVGTLLDRGGDSLVIQVQGIPSPVTVPLASARALAVSRGVPSRLASALRTSVDGALLGAALSYSGAPGWSDTRRGSAGSLGAATLVGLLGGAVVGVISPTERWSVVHRNRAPLPPLQPMPLTLAVGYSNTMSHRISGQGPTVEAGLPIGRLRGRLQPRVEALYHSAELSGVPVDCELVADPYCIGRSDDVTMYGANLAIAIVDRKQGGGLRWYAVPLGVGAYRLASDSREVQADSRTCLANDQFVPCGGSVPFAMLSARHRETALGLSTGAGIGVRIGKVEPTLGLRYLLAAPGRRTRVESFRLSLGLLF